MALVGVGLLAGGAMATLVLPGNETSLNQVFIDNNFTINANSDQITNDLYWQPSLGTQSGAWASMLIEIAGNSAVNTFGIYDQAGNSLQLMAGAASAGDKVSLSWSDVGLTAQFQDFDYKLVNGVLTKYLKSLTTLALDTPMSQTFGFYLGTNPVVNGNQTIFKSDFNLNPDGSDQMVSYMGTAVNGLGLGHYIIAFEDTSYNNSDKDFNDMVLVVESVNPVPEPATMLLFGAGVAALAAVARRKKEVLA